MHQEGSQDFDRFVVHWYIVKLENPCQLFRQLTNVRQTHSMLSSVGFSHVDVLFISLWLHGVENPRFVIFVYTNLNPITVTKIKYNNICVQI